MILEPGFGLFASIFRIIILLEDDILAPFLKVLDGLLEFILQNADIKVGIHPTLNPSGIANSFLAYIAPHHQGSYSKLDSRLNQSFTKPLSLLLSGPLPPI
jgi:hypothetical protein